jgi:hypothetical protein
MKRLALLSLIVLAACTRPGVEQVAFPNLPDELSGCTFYRMTDESGTHTLVGRCPNSVVTVKTAEKAPEAIVVDQLVEVQPVKPVEKSKPTVTWIIEKQQKQVKYDPLDR